MNRERLLIALALLIIMAIAMMDEKVWGPARLKADLAAEREATQKMEDSCFEATGRHCVMPTREQMNRNIEEASEGITEMLRGRE